jgi:hypothetical protein
MGPMSAAVPKPPHPGPAEIGLRVTMRLHESGGPTELLGFLETLTTIRKRNGEIVTFDPEQVVAWRIVLPPTKG